MLLIDGIVFSLQRAGGISVYFKTLIDFLAVNDLPAALLLYNNLLPQSGLAEVKLNQIRQNARLLERYRACRLPERAKIFHSSYYRLPSHRNLPTVVTVYDFIYERFTSGPRRWVHTAQKNAAIRSAQEVICISQSTKDDLLNFVGEMPGQNIHVIHCGVSDEFHKLDFEQSKIQYVLFVGQRAGYKNFKLVLDSMIFLPELELYCVGGGAIQPSELHGVPISVTKRVKHLGFVSDEQLNVLYNRAICLVYPSSCEGFGIPVIEAMRAGCPVVCTRCKAVIEIGQDALIVVSEEDPELMAYAILRTVSSERPMIIKKGLVVSQAYSWRTCHSHTLQVYRSLGF